MGIKVNLLHDHGRTPSEGERFIIAKMLENAYAMGIKKGYEDACNSVLRKLQEKEWKP